MRISRATISYIVCLALLISRGSSSLWARVQTLQCLTESLADHVWPSNSISRCAITAKLRKNLTVVQFSSSTKRCAMFHYRLVCHLIESVASENTPEGGDCTVFASRGSLQFRALSMQLGAALGAKLKGAWVMSSDADASRTNLMCGGTQQWSAEAIEWTAEGAKFDGSSSRMTLEKAELFNSSAAFTFLFRLRRIANSRPLIINYNCTNGFYGTALSDGSEGTRGLYYNRRKVPTFTTYISDRGTNTYDSNTFVEIGVSSESVAAFQLYSNVGFVPPSKVYIASDGHSVGYLHQCSCFKLGHNGGKKLTGTVRAVALANDSMTEEEIGTFFKLVR